MTDQNIKIYISCHKDCYTPISPLLFPIQVGSALAEKRLPDMLHDDTGDNISYKNRMYCELTAQYWAWKNDTGADYYGFWHYRRYFSFSEKELAEDDWGSIVRENLADAAALNELGLDEGTMRGVIAEYDVIAPKKFKLPKAEKSVYNQYGIYPGHFRKDFDLMLDVLREKYPEYAKSAIEYINSDSAYYCNMFVMRRGLFMEYSAWLFDILFEVERRLDISSYSMTEARVLGYLGERMFGIWLAYNAPAKNLKVLELQRVLFRNTSSLPKIIKTSPGAVVTVMAANDAFVPYLSVLLDSIMQNSGNGRKHEIFVFTTDISEEHEKALGASVGRNGNFSLSVVRVNALVSGHELHVNANMHISIDTYYRFLILYLFHNTQKVLYLDCDTVVNADIAELYDIDMQGNCIAAVRDVDCAGAVNQNKDFARYVRETLGCFEPAQYFQAGVMLFDIPAMRAVCSAEELFGMIQERNWTFMDQDILNFVYRNKILYLDQAWNTIMDWREPDRSRMDIMKNAPLALYMEYLSARKAPKIIHYAGYQKPWNTAGCDFAAYFWKYARQTEFYEEILTRLFSIFVSTANFQMSKRLSALEQRMRRAEWLNGIAILRKIKKVCRRIKNNIRGGRG